jgi:hypothetical protein
MNTPVGVCITQLEKSQNFQHIQIACFLLLLYSSAFCPNKKKEIYNDKYRHTGDRLFGLRGIMYVSENIWSWKG